MFNEKDMTDFAFFYKGVLDESIPLPVAAWHKVNKSVSDALAYWSEEVRESEPKEKT